MKTFGLIGFPLSHSFSQKYFTEKFKRENSTDAEFINFPIKDINDLRQLILDTPSLLGLSVTIPHKQNIMGLLDGVDPVAKNIGAVNCIKIKDGKLIGHNTDAFGFEQSLKPLLKAHHTQALILGTGGASKAVAYILDKSKIIFRYVSRNIDQNSPDSKTLSYTDLNAEILSKSTLIINTTPVGMFPNVNEYPDIPYKFITDRHLLYDLTYNPVETLFLKKGKEKGAQVKNGLEMLHIQAEIAWEIWNS